MVSLNKVALMGRLGSDPEARNLGDERSICQLSVATSESWTDQVGQKTESTQWHRVVVWGKLAEVCSKYLAKGSLIYVDGKLKTRSFNDPKAGFTRYVTEIHASSVLFLDGRLKAEDSAEVPNIAQPDSTQESDLSDISF